MAQVLLHDLGMLLRRHRIAAGLTQEELAERAGLSARGISDLERGVNRAAHRATLQQLADALDLSPADRLALEDSVTRRRGPSAATTPTRTSLPTGRFLGALPEGTLIAREEELGRLLSAIDAVEGGSGRLVLLAGEPGVGKTRLAQEVTLHVHSRGFLVASGRCYEPEQSVPYFPFLDVLSTAYLAAPPSIQREVGHRWPHLGRLLPDLVADRGREAGGSQDEQPELFRAITGFLEAVAGIAPVALLLDDLHWADDSSLMLLAHVARHTYSSHLLILGTHRDAETRRQHRLRSAIVDLSREGLVDHIVIGRLKEEETAALIAATMEDAQVSDEFAELVHRRTDGNPFFVQQVLRALVEHGDVYRQGGYWLRRAIEDMEVPESVRAAIWQRLSRLGGTTQQILSEASVLGQVFAFEDLQGIGDRAEGEVEEALEEAVGSGLIRQSAGRHAPGEEYAFDHVLTQEALYADLLPRQRKRLHLAAGEALERLPERQREKRAAELAWHFRRGGDAMRSLPYAVLAGSQAETVFAHGEAEWHYRLVLELARESDNHSWGVAALEKLGTVLRTVARYDEALQMWEQAAQSYAARGESESHGRVLALIGEVHYHRGTPEQGIARLQPVLAAAGHDGTSRTPAAYLPSVYAALSLLFFASGRYDEALAAAERASNLAGTVGDQGVLPRAEVSRALALLALSRRDEAQRVLEEVVPLAETAGDLDTLARALDNLSNVHYRRGEFDKSRAYLLRGLEVAERMGDPATMAHMLFMLGGNAFWVGDWSASHRYLNRIVAIVQALGESRISALPPYACGLLALHEGDEETASRYLEESVPLAERTGNLPILMRAHSLLAERELREGNPASALARLVPLLDRPGLEGSATLLVPLAQAYLALGNEAAAEAVVAQALSRATADDDSIDLSGALRVSAMLAVRQRRWDSAMHALDNGLSLTRRMNYAYGEALFLYEYGMMHHDKGETEQARQPLQEALPIFQRLGARSDVERTEQSLREYGQL